MPIKLPAKGIVDVRLRGAGLLNEGVGYSFTVEVEVLARAGDRVKVRPFDYGTENMFYRKWIDNWFAEHTWLNENRVVYLEDSDVLAS